MSGKGHYTHRLSRTAEGKHSPLHHVWTQMRQRCMNPNDKNYKSYGGREIAFCPEWDDFAVFHTWALSHGYEQGLTIERINNDGNYEPANCKWIPLNQQRRNNRRVIKVTHEGRTQILSDWSKELGIKFSTLYARITKGIPIEIAFQKKEEIQWDRKWKRETRKQREVYPKRQANGQFQNSSQTS